MNILTLLDVEIEDEFNELSGMPKDSKERAALVDSLTKFLDRKIEIVKIEEAAAQSEKQMKEERKTRFFRILVDIGGIVLPLVVTVWGAKASFRFEETGTITTAIGRKFMDKLIKR